MAITAGDRHLWVRLRDLGAIPVRPDVLEIGRANWYGDVSDDVFQFDLAQYREGPAPAPPVLNPWTRADWYYRFMLRDPKRTAVDLDPHAPDCQRWNLNEPLPIQDTFDVVVNTGTNEHVFDQRQVWETCHDHCRDYGLMVHAMPLWGWLDHGFYNYHPTFVADLAAANEYKIVVWIFHELDRGFGALVTEPSDFVYLQSKARDPMSRSAMMHVAFRKKAGPFRVPMQGVYSERSTSEQVARWQAAR
jgi:SAM-dependent methyltransferase